MNKKNKMSMWSIGLGSTFLMMMLASSENTQDGQARSGISSSAVGSNVSIHAAGKRTAESHIDNKEITPEMINQLLTLVAET